MQERSIFMEALEFDDLGERSAYVLRACGENEPLRARVEALLRRHQSDHELVVDRMPAPGFPMIGEVDWPPEGPGVRIGPYRLLEQIGEGGMGVVYAAEQAQPVRRRVALKVVKPGMDSKHVVARFEAERQALAMMDHPNIARIFDGGVTESGRPYFVMELVRGLPITEYCDGERLSIRERLELFVLVCRAVQHAHQKGIIHRDLKPSNILVSYIDGAAVPKVIDFGVAKAIGGGLSENTVHTALTQLVGTPLYMSPEQVELSGLDVDTRSDIYSLGVLLYELLTGTTPFDRETLRGARFDELRRLIREEEPPRPSIRLSSLEGTLPTACTDRGTASRLLNRSVRGELDWIVMKALEKDRRRRYETASDLAADVRRHLNDEPVLACPPRLTYILSKLARKYRAVLTTIGAFGLLLVTATALSAWLAVQADRDRRRAVRAEQVAKDQQARALDREQTAIEAVRRFGDVVRDTSELKNDPELADLRARLLKEPLAFFTRLRERLQADGETTPESLGLLADASFALGQLTSEVGDKRDALRAFEDTRTIWERLADTNPGDEQILSNLAGSIYSIGAIQSELGLLTEAVESLGHALVIYERLALQDSTSPRHQGGLARTYNNIGVLQAAMGRSAEALATHERALEIRKWLVGTNPTDEQAQGSLAGTLYHIGDLQAAMGYSAEAMPTLDSALSIFEKMARENPSNLRPQGASAMTLNRIGELQCAVGSSEAAMASLDRARTILERLVQQRSAVTQVQSDLARSHDIIGAILARMGRKAEALASLELALGIRERLAREHPSITQIQLGLAVTLERLGRLQEELNHAPEALTLLERAFTIRERLARELPETREVVRPMPEALERIVKLSDATGQHAKADDCRRKRLAIQSMNPIGTGNDHPR